MSDEAIKTNRKPLLLLQSVGRVTLPVEPGEIVLSSRVQLLPMDNQKVLRDHVNAAKQRRRRR